nr:MAG TPA: hypothetical protein [Caudoviricetes sp.]
MMIFLSSGTYQYHRQESFLSFDSSGVSFKRDYFYFLLGTKYG